MTTNAQTQRVFLALADPTRRLLFEQLCAQGSGTAASFATRLPITRQAITKHLVALEQAGLVTVHETGRERRYVPQPASLQTITTWIAAAEAQWDHRLAALRSYLLEELSAPSAQENKTHALEASRQERIQDMTKTIEKQRVIHATPQRTFQALTEKAELERWFVQKAEGTMRPGETMRFEWAPDMVE